MRTKPSKPGSGKVCMDTRGDVRGGRHLVQASLELTGAGSGSTSGPENKKNSPPNSNQFSVKIHDSMQSLSEGTSYGSLTTMPGWETNWELHAGCLESLWNINVRKKI